MCVIPPLGDSLRQEIRLVFKEGIKNCYLQSIDMHGAKTWALRKIGYKWVESIKIWCWRRIGWTCQKCWNITWSQWGKNVLRTVKRNKANWIGQTLHSNCLLKHFIGGKVEGRREVTGKWERSHKQLLEDRKERIGYWKFKEEAPDRSFWRTRFGRAMDL